MKRLMFLVFLTPLVSVAAYGQTCTGSDTLLQKHIYHPDRLTEAKRCITVTRTVIWKKPQADGDIHYRLMLDPGQGSGLINAKNTARQHGALVFEPVCVVRRLPNGERVRIESCEGKSATVWRIDGDRAGTLAVCDIAKLEPLDLEPSKIQQT